MRVKDIILKTRSCRRFNPDAPIGTDTLLELTELGRLGASAANKQPLKFILVQDKAGRDVLFDNLKFAAYLKDWDPTAEEAPTGYIIILGDTTIAKNFWCDHGIAAQNILLGATEKGLGGCILGAINKPGVAKAFAVPDHLEILLVLALGEPAEEIRLDPLGPDGDIRYWRDGRGVHHVPKRSLEELVFAVNPAVSV